MSETMKNMRSDMNSARKAKDAQRVLTLSTLIGQMMAKATIVNGDKVVSEESVQQVLKTASTNLSQNISAGYGDVEAQNIELALVESYRPTIMSESDLRTVINKIREAGHNDMKNIMANLKADYAGLYDGKMASNIIREAN